MQPEFRHEPPRFDGGPHRNFGRNRRRAKSILNVVLIVLVVAVLVAGIITTIVLVSKNNNKPEDNDVEIGTIYYFENGTAKSKQAVSGQNFTLPVQVKSGYTFKGYYDSGKGGVQYVNEMGVSVSLWSGSGSMVFYPRFEANRYTIVLDYQGGTGGQGTIGTIDVVYDQWMAPLEASITKKGCDFAGWYTMPNGKGARLTDEQGVFLNGEFFDFNTFPSTVESKFSIYAFYTPKMLTITFQYADGSEKETDVSYGTVLSESFSPKDKLNFANGGCTAFSGWTLARGYSEVYTGIIDEEYTFYEKRSPVLYFDTNGGYVINEIVGIANAVLPLPTPAKEGCDFLGWAKDGGVMVDGDTIVLPSNGLKLTAIWQVK